VGRALPFPSREQNRAETREKAPQQFRITHTESMRNSRNRPQSLRAPENRNSLGLYCLSVLPKMGMWKGNSAFDCLLPQIGHNASFVRPVSYPSNPGWVRDKERSYGWIWPKSQAFSRSRLRECGSSPGQLRRRAISSATIEMAISSGVTAEISRPIGAKTLLSRSEDTPSASSCS